MTDKKLIDNERAVSASSDREKKNLFLIEERDHILYLTARILRKTVTDSDDEFSIALSAVSEALDSYRPEKGVFWNYASLVIKSRIYDAYRKTRSNNEILLDPNDFAGETDENDTGCDIAIKNEINRKTAVYVDNSLKDELEALQTELNKYDIDLFDLPEAAPKSGKTKESCRELILSFFLPPPLLELLRKTGKLPVNELVNRTNVSRKLIDRHRKFILASILIKAGDYSEISGYIEV